MTLGCWPNSGTAFTIPSTFTMRFTRSSDPSSWRITATRMSPVSRACRYASSTEMPAPTFPVTPPGPLPER